MGSFRLLIWGFVLALGTLGCGEKRRDFGTNATAGTASEDASSAGGGKTTVGGACGADSCDAGCVDTATDARNCGACGHDCSTLPNIAVPSQVTCREGKCEVRPEACAPGFLHCSTASDDGCETDANDPEHCGDCSTQCRNDVPFCADGVCVTSCPEATPTECGQACTDITNDPLHCGDCQTACLENQICIDGKCRCDGGANLCGDKCRAPTDVDACGTRCVKCLAPTGGSISCDGTNCVNPTCPSGQQICAGACIGANAPCNGDCPDSLYLCPDGVCRDTNTLSACGQTCKPCATKVNAAATTCEAGKCGYTCNSGFIECSDKSCGRVQWDFDSGTTQGWATTLDSPNESVALSASKKFSGTASLAGRQVNGDGYHVYIEAKICNGLTTNLLGRRFKAQILMDMAPTPGGGQTGAPNPYLCLSWKDSEAQYTADNGCQIPNKSGWYGFISKTTVGIDDLTGVRLEIMLGTGWNGRAYIDDIQLAEE